MNGFTTGKAGGTTQQLGEIPASYSGDALDLARSQRLAQMLSSSQPAQGQVVSGRYVAPSWTQNLAQLVNTGLGAYYADKAETQQQELAKKIREGQNAAMADYMTQLRGRPEVQGGIYGPDGKLTTQTTADMYGPNMELNPAYKQVAPVAAVAGNPYLANMNAAQNDMLPSWLRQNAIKELTKGPDWKELTKYNQATGNTETYRYNANSQDPTSTMQFLGVSKPALSVADQIRFRDEGINTNINGLTSGAPISNAPTGGSPTGGAVQTSPVSAKPATAVKDDGLVKAFGYDPFKPPPPPAGITSGKDLRNYRAEQAKPLTGTAADQVTGAKLYTDSLNKYKDYVNSLTASDLLNPSVRVKLTSLHSQAKLAGKEANKLGVLNGGDERILEEVLPNYKDISVTKKNLNNLIQGQKEFGTSIIVNAYGTQQKAIPENMRKYVVVPEAKETDSEKQSKSSTPTRTQRAVLNGQNIVVKNGKWVYESTGKAVE